MRYSIVLLIVAAFLFNACSSIKVTHDMDKSVDFTQFKTFEYYGWAEESDKILNPLDKERIENAFGAEFKKRGMTYVEEGGDLIVTLFIVAEKKTERTAHTTSMGGMYGGYGGYGGYYGYGPGWGYGGGYSTTSIREYDYVVGTLVCDVFDAKNQKLIWEGIGSKTVDENRETRDRKVPQAVAAIMARYPMPPIK